MNYFAARGTVNSQTDFSLASEEMYDLFNKRDYPASVIEVGHHRAKRIDQQSELQT